MGTKKNLGPLTPGTKSPVSGQGIEVGPRGQDIDDTVRGLRDDPRKKKVYKLKRTMQ